MQIRETLLLTGAGNVCKVSSNFRSLYAKLTCSEIESHRRLVTFLHTRPFRRDQPDSAMSDEPLRSMQGATVNKDGNDDTEQVCVHHSTHQVQVQGQDTPAAPRPSAAALDTDADDTQGAGVEEAGVEAERGEQAGPSVLGKRARRRSSAVSVDISQFEDFYGVTDRDKQDHSLCTELSSVVHEAERRRSLSDDALPCQAWDGFFGGQAATSHIS